MKKHHKVVVVGGGLSGSSIARGFAKEFAGSDDSVLLIDAFPAPEAEDIGHPDSQMIAGFGTWQRFSPITACSKMALRSKEIFADLEFTLGDTILKDGFDVSVATNNGPGTILEKYRETADNLGMPYEENTNPKEIHPDYAHRFVTFEEPPESSGIIHMNKAILAMQDEVLKNEHNEVIHNFEVNKNNTAWNKEKQLWEITLENGETITADHLTYATGAKGVMDLLHGNAVHEFIAPGAAKEVFFPQRAPAFIYYFPEGHGLKNLSFTNRDNTTFTDVMFSHPEGKYLYFARFSDPANPIDTLEQRLGADNITAIDEKIMEQRLSILNPEIAEQIRSGKAEKVGSMVYRYTSSYSGHPYSHVRKGPNGESFSYFLGEGGGSAKICPALGEEHARQVLGIDLQFPEEMKALTEEYPRYFEMVKNNLKRGGDAKRNPLVKEPDMYGFERMLNHILKIDEEFATQYKTADDSIVRNLMKLVEASPQLQEFVSASHIMHETLSYDSLDAQRNLMKHLKTPTKIAPGKNFDFYQLVIDKLKEVLAPAITDTKQMDHDQLNALGQGIEVFIEEEADEHSLLVERAIEHDGKRAYKAIYDHTQAPKLRLTQQIIDIDRDRIIKYSAGEILFEAAMSACLDKFHAKYPAAAQKYRKSNTAGTAAIG